MEILSLNGVWSLGSADGNYQAVPATVPGCVHTDLIANNLLENPFYRDNESRQFWVGETDWSYSRTFEVAPELLKHERVLLRCHGLDTLATIYINGEHLATTENMFRTYELDVKALLQAGENTLEIRFDAPMPYVRKMDAERGEMGAWINNMRLNSGGWIRKEPSNFGWDWGPKLPTVGIWRDIELVAFDTARLSDVLILQEHGEETVSLQFKVNVERLNDLPLHIDITVKRGEQVVASAEHVAINGTEAEATLTLTYPELWWVAGMGDQALYEVTVRLVDENNVVLDDSNKRIGLRVLQLERHRDEWGESFYFSCNGVPFFAKGANWIPASAYPAEPTRADFERLAGSAVAANMNMLRVWGGGLYEDDHFYDVCDEMGIAVWQDFIFACGTYPSFDEGFMRNVEGEARDNIKRIRHHASLALWCGNNEIEQGMSNDGWKYIVSWEDYGRLFDVLLKNLVTELDPQRDYWPGSPHSPHGDREDWINPDWGDTHLWKVWHGKEPFEWYRTRPDRFCSEFGFQSFPQPATIYEVTAPEDRNITSHVLEHFQRSQIGNSTIIHYMLDWYQLPTSFESMVWLSQILQGMAMKYAVEHWRRNMPRTMGTLYWQLNDLWSAPSWSSMDWKGNWKALHYMTKRFYAPLLISGLEKLDDETVEIHITSDKATDIDANYRWYITTASGQVLDQGEQPVTLPPRTSQCVRTLDVSAQIAEHGVRDVMVWLELQVGEAIVSENLVLLARPKHLKLGKPEFNVTVTRISPQQYDVTLTSDVPALYTWLSLEPDSELPSARYSTNFVDLRSERPVTISVTFGEPVDEAVFKDALNVQSLVDTHQN